jgi:HK97 family phage major capsid protein
MAVSAELITNRKEFEAKQDKIMKVFKDAGKEIDLMKASDLTGKDGKERAEEVKKMNLELEDLGKEVDSLASVEEADKQAKLREKVIKGWKESDIQLPHPGEGGQQKSIGELFTECKAYKERKAGNFESEISANLKTVMTTAAGWAPQNLRTGKEVDIVTRPIQIIDIIPAGQTGMAAIVYMEETTLTNTAAEAAENTGAAVEATLALTQRTSTVRKITVYISVTDEQLDDVSGVQSYINQRLGFMLRQRLDSQILQGNGVAPNLMGIQNTVGIQTFARAGNHFDEIAEGIRRVRVVGGAMPTAIVIHSTNWWSVNMKLAKTLGGEYVWGHPSEPGPSRIWGVPMVETEAVTVNTVIVGDFQNFIQLFEKNGGITMKITDSNGTDFVHGVQAIRADLRVALPVYRPAAFCAITNMA